MSSLPCGASAHGEQIDNSMCLGPDVEVTMDTPSVLEKNLGRLAVEQLLPAKLKAAMQEALTKDPEAVEVEKVKEDDQTQKVSKDKGKKGTKEEKKVKGKDVMKRPAAQAVKKKPGAKDPVKESPEGATGKGPIKDGAAKGGKKKNKEDDKKEKKKEKKKEEEVGVFSKFVTILHRLTGLHTERYRRRRVQRRRLVCHLV